jgi:hypothetical protein
MEGTRLMSSQAVGRVLVALVLASAWWPTSVVVAQEDPDQLRAVVEPQPEERGDDEGWLPPGFGLGPTSWDLYTGSIYANSGPLWVQAEALMWWLKGNPLPPLVTTSPNSTDAADAGVLGLPDTGILAGNGRVDSQMRGGFRTAVGIRLGYWVDWLMDAELEAGLMWVGDGQSSGDFFAESLGDPILARPYVDAQTGLPASRLVAYPGIAEGFIDIETSSDLLSTGIVFRRGWRESEWGRLDWLAGYRYLRLQEELFARENFISLDPAGAFPVDTEVDVIDIFNTRNEFHGVDLGLKYWVSRGPWSLELTGKVAVGALSRILEIDGSTVTLSALGDVTFFDSGFYVLPTNEGRYRSSQLSALPEIGFTLRRQITHDFIFTFGYSLLVVNNVVRSGDQVDLNINPSQFNGGTLVGPAEPSVRLKESVLWAHGFNIGVEW